MRKTLEDFYYGNHVPSAQEMAPDSELRRMTGKAADCQDQLMERLGEPEQKLLDELIEPQFTIDSITAEENFILGFRLGIRMMLECMDDNDGNIRGVAEDG